ncbi:purine nucleosidase [Paenibacillus sp. yr247]|uniref:nucleoside hydrolase n=1 Tax=Paenibacillus sp. yr247 TaxID=1761880 RepID=UPI00088775C6|nr:nucleoside hydrolase [Paenibacillus sp. yr247]SDN71087.1 purine nucleosidase [Paenibacillus sp. yr247]
MTSKKVWLDTDIGGDIDDALCLAYLLRHPSCELIGVTTVGGEVEKRAMVADAICKAAGKSIPIYAGTDKQLLPSGMYPTPDGAVKLSNWEHETSFQKYQAVDFMRKTIHENPYEISLLAIGHLTNIALLFLIDPEIPKLIKELYIMSGVFSEESENRLDLPEANWNSWLDPHACAIVYNTNVPIIKTFGLNVTTKLMLNRHEKDDLFSSDIMRAVEDFGSPWLENNDMTFHDPLVAACLFEPQLCEYQRGFIDVDFKTEQRLGMMSFRESDAGSHQIATAVNRNHFFEHYFSVICK